MAASVAYTGGSAIGGPFYGGSARQKPGEGGCADPEPASSLTAGNTARRKVAAHAFPAGGKPRAGRYWRPADPGSPPGGVAHPFADPVGNELALHLGDRGKDREDQAPGSRRRVELGLSVCREPHPRVLESLQGAEGMKGRAERPVELPDQDEVDPPSLRILEGRAQAVRWAKSPAAAVRRTRWPPTHG